MDDSTIAAVSSPAGIAARGIVRVGGPEAMRIVGTVFRPEDRQDNGVGRARRVDGALMLPGLPELPCAAYFFQGPRSYTGEDVAEMHVPGSPGLLALVMDALLGAGARAAEPGEFTRRAVRNGKMDLAAAEGVAEVIAARFDGQLRAARRLMDGGLSRMAAAAADELLDLRSQVEASLDFADEDIAFIQTEELLERLLAVRLRLEAAAGARERAERLIEPPRVVLAGPPNAGKSTLLNRLSGMERAICSPMAGTTRDAICAPISLAHGEALLCDTPGVEETPKRRNAETSKEEVEIAAIDALAHEAAMRAARQAAVVVWMTAVGNEAQPPVGLEASRLLRVKNKCDTLAVVPAGEDPLYVSARTGAGCARLVELLSVRLAGSDEVGDEVILSAELRAAMEESSACIGRAMAMACDSDGVGTQAELVAAELLEAADWLGRLSGGTDVDELYDRVFSRFCVGK